MTRKTRFNQLFNGFRQKLREMEQRADADFAQKQAEAMIGFSSSFLPTMQADASGSEPSAAGPVEIEASSSLTL